MERQFRGVAVLLLAGFVVLAVAVSNAPGIAGSASSVPPDAPPMVGDCLLGNNETAPLRTDMVDANGIAMSSGNVFGACSSEHYGEVMAIFPGGSSVDVGEKCSGSVLSDYLGADPGEPFQFAPWQPQINFRLNAAIPGQRQMRDGQDWLACLVGPPNGGPYLGSIRHGFGAGEVPGAYSTCTDQTPRRLPSNGPCDQPHSTENLAYQFIDGPGPSPSELHDGCRDLAGYRLAGFDAIAGGELNVQVLVYLQDGQPRVTDEAVPEGQRAQAFCQIFATGGRPLNGSLLGIADGPIPWA